MKSFAAPVALLVLTLALAPADHHGEKKVEKPFPLIGEWKAEAESDSGPSAYTFIFEEKESKVLGKSINAEGNERAMDRVKIEGKTVTIETDVESDGQTGIIRVVAEGEDSALKGKWSVVDSEGEERMSGDFSATRVFKVDLLGEWEATATVGEEMMKASVLFEEVEGKVKGHFIGEDEKKVSFTEIKVADKEVTFDFVNTIEERELDFRISAEAKSADKLDGKWVVFDESGQEGYTGNWIAERVIPFSLVGTWSTSAELPDGTTSTSVLTVTEGEDDKLGGTLVGQSGEYALTSVTLEEEKVSIVFMLGESKVTISAAVKDGKLDGKWSMASGDDALSGAWSATRT